MKKSYQLATVLLLTSTLLLGACSKQSQSTGASSSTKSSQTTKTSSKSSSTTKKSSTSSSQASSTETTASLSQSQTEQSSTATVTTAQSSINVGNLSNNDFSTVSGTWKDDLGNSVTVDANGQLSLTYTGDNQSPTTIDAQISFLQTIDGVYFGNFSGSPIIVIPAGVANPHDSSVSNSDRILIGQTADADMHPYYR